MKLSEAIPIAKEVKILLAPHCERIEVAGSVRRQKAQVKDIEIVAIPKPYDIGLFSSGIDSVLKNWVKVKGELPCKYTQRIYKGVKIDLFFAEPGNWGLIYAIRTGSADFSHRVLANGWVQLGYKSEGGYLYRNGVKYECREEVDLFNRLGIDWVNPEYREMPERRAAK